MKLNRLDWFIISGVIVLLIYFGSAIYFINCKVTPQRQKANKEIAQWEQKYNEEKQKAEKVFKAHPKLRKYFK